MNEKKNELDILFDKHRGEWDIYEPMNGHEKRFGHKLKFKQRAGKRWLSVSVAAAAVTVLGLLTFHQAEGTTRDLAYMSKASRETDSVFNAVIQFELERVKDQYSPVNEQLINDGLQQLEAMNQDYEKIKAELASRGESKQLINAMVNNLKTQISFLEKIMAQIEKNEQSKSNQNETIL